MKISIFLVLCLIYQIKGQNYSVDGRYIYNNGEVHTSLGINYSPIPIGGSQGYEESDLGDSYGSRWKHIYERDIPILREMGVNSIRVYNWYPWRFPFSAPYSESLRNDHTEFLDMLWNDGDQPITIWVPYHMPIIFHYKTSSTAPRNRESWRSTNGDFVYLDPDYDDRDLNARQVVMTAYEKIAEFYGSHPAVIGFVIGNEQNDEFTRFNPEYWKFVNDIAGMLKRLCPNKLTMVSIVDDGHITVTAGESLGLIPNLDVWGINSYRGTETSGFDTLFTDYAQLSNRPLLITEYGPPASTRDSAGNVVELPDNALAQAIYIRSHFEDIMDHRSICSGGYIFEYTDEWWKHSDPDIQNPSNVENPAYPGGYGDEEYFGIFSISMASNTSEEEDFRNRDPDILHPRAAVEYVTSLYHGIDIPDVPPQYDLIPEAPITPYEPTEPVYYEPESEPKGDVDTPEFTPEEPHAIPETVVEPLDDGELPFVGNASNRNNYFVSVSLAVMFLLLM